MKMLGFRLTRSLLIRSPERELDSRLTHSRPTATRSVLVSLPTLSQLTAVNEVSIRLRSLLRYI